MAYFFWNNLHQVRSKPINLKLVVGAIKPRDQGSQNRIRSMHYGGTLVLIINY
jgi:hypothetical protein